MLYRPLAIFEILCLLVLGVWPLAGQNLVPNGSFEDYIICPDSTRQLERARHWINPTEGTPDFYHRCAGAGPCRTCVPNYLHFGFQEPHSGDGFGGMFTTWLINDDQINYREYMQVELTEPLIAARAYQFTMYVVFSDQTEFASIVPQVLLSEDTFSYDNNRVLSFYTPQIDFDSLITDSDNWAKLSLCYVAEGGERFLTIGNFKDAYDTDILQLSPGEEKNPYYLLDDISLIAMSDTIDILPDSVFLCEGESYEAILPDEFDYEWSDGSTDNPRIISRTGRYIVKAFGDCGEVGSDTMWVIVDDQLDLNFPDTVFICENGSVLVETGSNFDSIVWSDGSTEDTFLITQPGLVWAEITNRCGTGRDSIFAIRVLDPTSDLPSDTIICEGDSLWLSADPSLNPIWEGNVFSDSFLITEAGTYVLELSNFCDIVTDIIIVTTVPAPSVDFGMDLSFCAGDSLQVTPEIVADDWQWLDGSRDSSRWFGEEGWIGIEATTDCGTIRDSVFLDMLEPPSPGALPDTLLCDNATWTISFPNEWTVLWPDGTMGSSYVVSMPGDYPLLISNACGSVRDTFSVAVEPAPILELPTTDLELCVGDSVRVEASSPNATITWEDNQGPGPSIWLTNEGTYVVRASNACGFVEDEVEVEVSNCGCQTYIPNAFTPNGDNINDRLEVFSGCPLENLQMQIYTRWGELIFESTGSGIFWDGRFGGEDVNPGVYVYRVSYEIAGEVFVVGGDVTVVR